MMVNTFLIIMCSVGFVFLVAFCVIFAVYRFQIEYIDEQFAESARAASVRAESARAASEIV